MNLCYHSNQNKIMSYIHTSMHEYCYVHMYIATLYIADPLATRIKLFKTIFILNGIYIYTEQHS